MAVALATSTGCIYGGPPVPVGEMVTETSTISVTTAKSVTVLVDVGVCDLVIEGGAGTLMDAEFTYNVPSWKPTIAYTESGSHGTLTVRQSTTRGSVGRGADCDWHLRFSDDIALTIKVDTGVGHSELDLTSMTLTELDVDAGVGDTVVKLGDIRSHDVTIGIDSGVGDIVLRLPGQTNVILDCDTGVGGVDPGNLVKRDGAYMTDTPAESGGTFRINVDIGVGDLRIIDPEPHTQI